MTVDLGLGHTDLILAECRAHSLLRNEAAYVLATAKWETNHTIEPVAEAYWVKNAEAWRKQNLRYYPWYGRGFVQLTWEDNYIKAGKALGIDLTQDPSRAMDPEIAAKVIVLGMKCGWFTGKKLSQYITLSKSDFKGARRIVNGTDKDAEIAAIAVDYDNALKIEGYGEDKKPPTLIERLIQWLASISNRQA